MQWKERSLEIVNMKLHSLGRALADALIVREEMLRQRRRRTPLFLSLLR